MTTATAQAEPIAPQQADERFVIHDVPWHLYVSLRDSLDERGSHLRLTYLKGQLELMRPSREHEEQKGLIGHLIEAWCIDRGVEIFVQGSTTYREERAERGLEPDESYSFGTRKDIPELAIEVVHSRWRVGSASARSGSFETARSECIDWKVMRTFHSLGAPCSPTWIWSSWRGTRHRARA